MLYQVTLLLLVFSACLNRCLSLSCVECKNVWCDRISNRDCLYGIGKEACGCCDVCLKGPGEECGGSFNQDGNCGAGYTCKTISVGLKQRERQFCLAAPKTQCKFYEFQCDDGNCTSGDWVCNRFPDCSDGSDENDCDYTRCASFEFRCKDNSCISIDWRCNGYNDCTDGSDELSCSDSELECKKYEFRCDNSECRTKLAKCDGIKDCSDGSDEVNCNRSIEPICLLDQFQCDDGSCIHHVGKCNGHSDCPDGSDERRCTIILPVKPIRLELPKVDAPAINFECGRQGHSIKKRSMQQYIPHKELFHGIDTRRESWPWMALLGRQNFRGDVTYFCGGALINEKFVITAAHCLPPRRSPYHIRLGSDIIEETVLQNTMNIAVDASIIQPRYIFGQHHHDLALIKLAENIRFRNDVGPICLPWGSKLNADLIGAFVTVTGQGAIRHQGPSSKNLQEIQIEVLDPLICHNAFKKAAGLTEFNAEFPKGITIENSLCAGIDDRHETQRDSCSGDSGGPLVHNPGNDIWTLAGIVSVGVGCGQPDVPGIYAPLRNVDYLKWIKDVAFS